MISATHSATHAVDAHNPHPTTTGISTAAVATRFQVMEKEVTPERRKAYQSAFDWGRKESRAKKEEWKSDRGTLTGLKTGHYGGLFAGYAGWGVGIGGGFADSAVATLALLKFDE